MWGEGEGKAWKGKEEKRISTLGDREKEGSMGKEREKEEMEKAWVRNVSRRRGRGRGRGMGEGCKRSGGWAQLKMGEKWMGSGCQR